MAGLVAGMIDREPSDAQVFRRDADDGGDAAMFGSWTSLPAPVRLGLVVAGIDNAEYDAFLDAGVESFRVMRAFRNSDVAADAAGVYLKSGVGWRDAIRLARAQVSAATLRAYQQVDPSIDVDGALALKAAGVGKGMMTELRLMGVVEVERMVSVASKFTAKAVADFRRAGATVADLFNADGLVVAPDLLMLRFAHRYGIDRARMEAIRPMVSAAMDRLSFASAEEASLFVDRVAAIGASKGRSPVVVEWASAMDVPVEVAILAAAEGVSVAVCDTALAVFPDAADRADAMRRLLAAVVDRSAHVGVGAAIESLALYSQARPLTAGEIADAVLVAEHPSQKHWHGIIESTVSPSGRHVPDPASMARLVQVARGTGHPGVFFDNVNRLRSRAASSAMRTVVPEAASYARFGLLVVQVERARLAGIDDLEEAAAAFAALAEMGDSLWGDA